MSHFKSLLREINNVIDTKYYCCNMKPDGNINGPWELRGYSDMDYIGDEDTWKSVTGYIVLTNRAVIDCRLQSQKTVTLSIIEAKYLATTEVCCKILFVHAILLLLGVFFEYLITVHIDKFGDILIP